MAVRRAVTAAEFQHITRPGEMPPALREDLVRCWVAVTDAGGAVIPHGVGLPPVDPQAVATAFDRIVEALDPQRSRVLVATVDGSPAGWLLLRRDPHPLVAHCGVVNHLQTAVRFRGLGIGAALMRLVPAVAREEMGLERLGLSARSGLGLEDFYRRLGWVEVGRWPGALRIAPGDDRDEILMSLVL
ncbi:GNAT family N-acetyltransferase [Streptomyces sp. NPDC048002]|uniref:GNAT family N-acetyltransferase n=1 Tax=Streptomyces sp. NPDC048002 TaxID=3154344 RepID=UPI0033E2B8BC